MYTGKANKPSSLWQNFCQLIVRVVAISRHAFRCSILSHKNNISHKELKTYDYSKVCNNSQQCNFRKSSRLRIGGTASRYWRLVAIYAVTLLSNKQSLLLLPCELVLAPKARTPTKIWHVQFSTWYYTSSCRICNNFPPTMMASLTNGNPSPIIAPW